MCTVSGGSRANPVRRLVPCRRDGNNRVSFIASEVERPHFPSGRSEVSGDHCSRAAVVACVQCCGIRKSAGVRQRSVLSEGDRAAHVTTGISSPPGSRESSDGGKLLSQVRGVKYGGRELGQD